MIKINFKNLHDSADSLIGAIPAVKKRRRLNSWRKILKYFCLILFFLFSLSAILILPQIAGVKEIYNHAIRGKNDLEQAVIFAKNDDFAQAARLADSAENNFNFSINGIKSVKNNNLINRVPAFFNILNDCENILVSIQFLSKAAGRGANFAQSLENLLEGNKKLSFSKFSIEEKRGILKKIFESSPDLNGIKADLDLARMNLEQINSPAVFYIAENKIAKLKNQIEEISSALEKAIPFSQMIPALTGYPNEVTYLVMLQNNDELRPTGGFLGTYGILRVKDGEIKSFNTHDIYHLDMPVQNKISIEPPEPIKKYLNKKWYLRDSNWSPDWPSAARKISEFYQAESALNPEAEKISDFSGVLAITPEFVIDLLKITGPITVEGHDYGKDNFQDLLQYRVEKEYADLGISSWNRKEVIGPIFEKLKIMIFDLPSGRWPEIINAIAGNLSKKNLIFYLKDSRLENIAEQNGWAGEMKNNNQDCLMVVDANLAALKTDASMERSINYKVSEESGGLFAKLTLNYSHNGKPDWKTSEYKSYTRIYAPLGSRLIKISGYNHNQIDSGEEFGKTWFGFYLTVQPGKINNITINYELPRLIFLNNSYGLYIQKQPGKELNYISVDLNFANSIKSYSPANLSTQKIGSGRLKWKGDLSIDRNFEIKF